MCLGPRQLCTTIRDLVCEDLSHFCADKSSLSRALHHHAHAAIACAHTRALRCVLSAASFSCQNLNKIPDFRTPSYCNPRPVSSTMSGSSQAMKKRKATHQHHHYVIAAHFPTTLGSLAQKSPRRNRFPRRGPWPRHSRDRTGQVCVFHS